VFETVKGWIRMVEEAHGITEEPTSNRVEISAPMRNVLHGALRRSGKVIHPVPWVGLTDDEIQIIEDNCLEGGSFWDVYRAIEARLKEKNK
jgi:predicted metal-dependent RNase